MHWIVRVAASAGLPGADALDIPPRTDAAAAWAEVAETTGTSEDELADVVAAWFRLDRAHLEAADPLATRLIPPGIARQFGVFPIAAEDRQILVATSNPVDVEAEQQVGFASGRNPVFLVAPPADIARAIDANYAPDRAVADILGRVEGEVSEVTVVEEVEPEPDTVGLAAEGEDAGPIIRLTNMILEDAVEKGASDIHLQPLPTGGVIRLRIDGVLRSGINVPLAVMSQVISRIKVMSRLDISDRMRPQDGRARVRVGDRRFDLRVSTVPVRGGEKAVIRILDPDKSGVLEDAGLPEREVARLRHALQGRDGIIVITGPTGSGKTTTMYAALREIATEDVNIMTVEDPVEYELPGLTQIQVDAKKGITFHSALKAILRQDPDVIFVGEIRDDVTAEMAAQASLTGHLVLATVHANDAVGSVRRFLDLGLDAGTISETLRSALAQRLLRTLCAECAVPARGTLPATERTLVEQFKVRPAMRAVGCEACGNSGYRGRRPVVELLVPSTALLQMVASEASHVDLTRQARADGMRTLLEGGLELVREGVTTLTEMVRVIGQDAAEAALEPMAGPSTGRPGGEPVAPSPAESAAPSPAAPPRAAPPASSEAIPPAASAATPPTSPAPTPASAPPEKAAPTKLPPPAVPPPGDPARAAKAPSAAARTAKDPTPAARPSGARTAAAAKAPPRSRPEALDVAPEVLVVDDDADTRLLIRAMMESHGWAVDEAADAREALMSLGAIRGLSLIILDLGLPDMDGMEVLRAAKRSLATAGIPVVVLTGRDDPETERSALEEGATDFIHKPVNPGVFMTRARAALRRAAAM